MIDLTLLDYGVGNIHSLAKAFEAAGARVVVEADARKAVAARALLLPGVGAFGKVAEMIAPVRAELRERLAGGLPAFCVCIGMQILHESSEEAAGDGVALLPGRVRRLGHRRLPHIGWNTVEHRGTGPFEGVPSGAHFYFVHSFAPSPCTDAVVATCDYGGRFAAASVEKNVWAVQFHPEKSSDAGRRIIGNFVRFVESVHACTERADGGGQST
jgi:glutamine amidotransferase